MPRQLHNFRPYLCSFRNDPVLTMDGKSPRVAFEHLVISVGERTVSGLDAEDLAAEKLHVVQTVSNFIPLAGIVDAPRIAHSHVLDRHYRALGEQRVRVHDPVQGHNGAGPNPRTVEDDAAGGDEGVGADGTAGEMRMRAN